MILVNSNTDLLLFLFLSFRKIQNQESNFQQVGGLGPRNISVFCFCQVALYFRGIPSKFNRLSAYFKARHFRGILNFAGFLFFYFFFENNFWISRFSLNTTFCDILISRFHQNTFICYILFNFVVVLKTNFFMCVSFQHFRILGKAWNLCGNLNTFVSFPTHHWFIKILKTREKPLSGSKISLSSSSESTTGFINPKNRRSCNWL